MLKFKFSVDVQKMAIAALSCTALAGAAQAGLLAYTSRASFDAAMAALPGISTASEDFDSTPAGTSIADGASLGAFTYHYGSTLSASAVSIAVATGFGTTSPANFLGTNDGGLFQSGDDFALEFAAARAIGMYFISKDRLFDGDIRLDVGGVTALLLTTDEEPFGLADGHVFFLGLVDNTGSFSTTSIGSFCSPCGSFLFNIDDIVTARDGVIGVPTPGTLVLAILGLSACGALGRQRLTPPAADSNRGQRWQEL